MKQILIAIISFGAIGLGFSILLAYLDKKLKVKQDPRIEQVFTILPGLNCGACGFSGCFAFAQAIVKNKNIYSGCLPGGQKLNQELNEMVAAGITTPQTKSIAVCHCQANQSERKKSFIYQGITRCNAANLVGGTIDCKYGCLGFGDCLNICPVNAITMENKTIQINPDKCIGCGRCVKTCPRNLIKLIPLIENMYYVSCANKEKGPYVNSVCTRGCISCGICTKITDSPFYIKDNLSHLNYTKANNAPILDEALKKCPTKCILKIKH